MRTRPTLPILLLALSLPLSSALATPGQPAQTPLAAALDAAKKSEYADAEKQLLAITGADKGSAQIALAHVYLATGRYADASKAAQAAMGQKKGEAIAVSAEVLFRTGKRDDALKLLDQNKSETGPGGREIKLLLGEYRIASGHRQDAEAPLMDIIDDYNKDRIDVHDAVGLAIAGRAAYLLRAWKNSAQLYSESKKADAEVTRRALWESEVYLEKYDPGKAEENAKAALKIAPHDPDALVQMARIKLAQSYDFDAAEKLVKKALASNPQHAGAHAVLAGLSLRDMNIAAADKAVADGLAAEPQNLELLSMKAAIRFLADDAAGYDAAKKDVLGKNPEYSSLYSIIADYAEWEHRYDDIQSMMQEAVKVDPEDGKAWAELGMMQTRGGDETAGLASLQKAFSKDKYNVYVYNTLNLYEKQIPMDYDTVDAAPFKLRYPKVEEAVLARYVPRMMDEAFASMKARYGFVPTTPIQVELYGARQWFGVRTSGLPNIGIQGVCFGRVIASMSPGSEPFNWGNVLWHELGHVFAIQLSKNHVPRWFTEGLSEYETIARRPEWQRELDPELYKALKKNKLPGAADMNRAFTHVDDPNDVTVAYYAASQMLVFTAERYGFPKIVDALKLWGQAVRTPDVIQRAFGVSADEYDKAYRAWQLKRLARFDGQFMFDSDSPDVEDATDAVKKKPNDAGAHVDLALALLKTGKRDESQKEIDAALKLDPANMRAHFLAARAAAKQKDVEGIATHLAAIQKAGGDGFEVRMLLANVAEAKEDKKAMREHFEAAYAFDPMQSEPLKALYELAKGDKRDADVVDLLERMAPLEQHDHDVWRLLLDKLVAAKSWADVRRYGESAVFVDVHRAATHLSFARGLQAGGDHARAAFELETAAMCNERDKKFVSDQDKAKVEKIRKEEGSIHALLAKSYRALGRAADAKAEEDAAKKADPESDDLKSP